MTLWQFYAVFLVMCVVGVGICWAMLKLGARCPLLGRKRDTWAEKIRYKLMIGFLFVAAIASYETLPDMVNAFKNDLTDVATETAMDLGERAINGEDVSQEIGKMSNIEMPREGEVIWGEYDKSQSRTLHLLTAFWFALAWMCYVGNFAKSSSSWWQKLCKIIAYPLLSLVVVSFPLGAHYLNSDELMVPLALLVISGVLIVVSHDRTPLPPALPDMKNGGLAPVATANHQPHAAEDEDSGNQVLPLQHS